MSLPTSTESAAMLGQPDLVANPRAVGNPRVLLPDAATGTAVLPSIDALFLRADLGDPASNALGESYIAGLAANLYGGLSPKVVKSRLCQDFDEVVAELVRYASIGNLHLLIHGEADAMGIGPLAGGKSVSVTQFHDLLLQAAQLPQVTGSIVLDNCRIGTPPFLGTSWTLAEINTKGAAARGVLGLPLAVAIQLRAQCWRKRRSALGAHPAERRRVDALHAAQFAARGHGADRHSRRHAGRLALAGLL
jgi:hypothetical protein